MFNTLKEFHKNAQKLCEVYHDLEIIYWIDVFWCFFRYGASPNDYVRYEFYKKNGRERDRFITMRRHNKLCRILNKEIENKKLEDDKYKMNKKLCSYIKRKWMYVNKEVDIETVKSFVQKFPYVIVKPLHLSEGRGIKKISYNDIKNWNEFVEQEMLLEECIIQHEMMASLNPYSVNTIRVFTLANKKGEVFVIDSFVRMGITEACIDNASAGGIFAEVDISTGLINSIATSYRKKRYIFSPTTGEIIVGKTIPSWNLVVDLATNIAKELLHEGKRYLAIDIAIMYNGNPEVIEVNFFGDSRLRQSAVGYSVGKYREMKELMK